MPTDRLATIGDRCVVGDGVGDAVPSRLRSFGGAPRARATGPRRTTGRSASRGRRRAESEDASMGTKIDRREDVNPKEGERKYGDVEFADPVNNKYPMT